MLHNKRSHCNEKPMHRNEDPTQSKKKKKKKKKEMLFVQKEYTFAYVV